MIERGGYKFELNTVRGVHCDVNGCRHDYSAVIVTWPHGYTHHYCCRCYASARKPISIMGAEPTEGYWPTFDEVLEDHHPTRRAQ